LEEDEEFKLSDVIKFGLKDICNNNESTITDEDIEEILKKGKVRLVDLSYSYILGSFNQLIHLW
jgi:hypothetical protein